MGIIASFIYHIYCSYAPSLPSPYGVPHTLRPIIPYGRKEMIGVTRGGRYEWLLGMTSVLSILNGSKWVASLDKLFHHMSPTWLCKEIDTIVIRAACGLFHWSWWGYIIIDGSIHPCHTIIIMTMIYEFYGPRWSPINILLIGPLHLGSHALAYRLKLNTPRMVCLARLHDYQPAPKLEVKIWFVSRVRARRLKTSIISVKERESKRSLPSSHVTTCIVITPAR